jgi:hypothetical protein
MGTHSDFHITAVVHRWKRRAKAAEEKLSRIETVIKDFEDLDLGEDDGRRAGAVAFTVIRSIMKEPTPPNYR